MSEFLSAFSEIPFYVAKLNIINHVFNSNKNKILNVIFAFMQKHIFLPF
ncbi:hypothetical protein UNSW1_1572 [Campylobacter concisus UNSW1]|nr:hypothetical protein UNSW1_1572 [Campylobacter concisus UNSW1]